MTEFAYQIKIPKERIAVLIGRKGEIKKYIEEQTKTTIKVDSKEGDISVKGEDAIALYCTRDIIRAIGRGFNPEIAQLLLKQDYTFEVLNLIDYVKDNQIKRIKGRIIGREGKARTQIERHTETFISVFGKTVCIIGRTEAVLTAKRALEQLIKGSRHANVYKWLEKMRSEQKIKELEERDISEYRRENHEN
ncbi:RNA-processing protein [Candidatus Woesearchaeota archaeon]|nr:RNA-processing protein [Candidatus Woesearchaeota archaeon]